MTAPPAAGTGVVAAVAVAATLDAVVGEPPTRLHPVAWFGRAVGPLDREWARPLAVGAAGTLVLPLLAAGTGWALTRGAGLAHPWAGVAVAGALLSVTLSRRMLLDEARAVAELSTTDLPAARERLRSLAGRDAADLSAAQVRSAAVESLAENLADGLVAPLSAFAVLAAVSLPAAAAAAAWVKAVNTMDSMLGYREKRVGAPAARLDDAVMWLPARASALLLAVAAGAPRALAAARPDAGDPPSPNSGWPMATLAVALGVRLAKPGVYDLHADADLPGPGDAERALRVTGRAGWLAFAAAAVAGWALAGAAARSGVGWALAGAAAGLVGTAPGPVETVPGLGRALPALAGVMP